ncbi:PREDICTED: uncharacterized protein LOC104585750 [Nelumbo nucifera]|uniref:Uncharacterized protein LOC104585750 n=2 Tax=Nelumbo nucifera TaxID=4432 RepID=A0A1U7YTI8_NELNU|nr:PREDICTED: uncharacterized protein LOC104585750 [Nelumbo nucifera]DAD20655.1 TPA_asm: hypothetical protein HUJ06_022118 [Nelumbo nucifera]
MARPEAALICLLIMAMDITAGILGIQAEIDQNKEKHIRLWIFECRNPSYEAFKLGLVAAALLALAHVLANLIGGCVCICSQMELETASANKQLAVGCLILSWIIVGVGFLMLIIGTMANLKSRRSCGISHHHFLSIGGVLCFVHGLFCTAYYVSAAAAIKEEEASQRRQNV